MTQSDWFARFKAQGPGYAGRRMSVAEVQALLLKAGIGSGLPLGHAQDLSALSHLLMSDPHLLGMAAAALDGPQHIPVIEGTDAHVVIEQAKVLMAGPMIIDRLIAGAQRVVVQNLDWPLLLWPYLVNAEAVYGVKFALNKGDRGVVMISLSDRAELDPIGEPQPVPDLVHDKLQQFAAKTYVPASEASRNAGAGAGLSDND